ncbi:MAG TPA: ABC transporter permease [Armatimonadota bacterium]|nr:ABC transporter permease [Armatimonadota bacterium]
MTCREPLRRTMAIARAEWRHNYRDPRSLAVVILLPVLLLLIYGYGVNFDLRDLKFAVYDLDRTQASGNLVRSLSASDYFTLTNIITDRRDIHLLIEQGQVRFVMVIERGFGEDIGAGRTARVQVLLDGADSTTASTALGYLEALMRSYSAQVTAQWADRAGVPVARLAPPLAVEPRVLYNPELRSVNFIVPGLIAVILTLLAALLTSGCIVREREAGSFESLAAAPVAPIEIILGKLLPYAAISFADIILCIVVGWLLFGVVPVGNKAALLVVSLVYLVASMAIGLLISSLARTHQIATILAFLTTMLPAMLLAGFVFPLRSMPLALQVIGQVIPATHFLVVIRGIYLKGAGLQAYYPQAVALVLISAVLVTISALRFNKNLE